MNGSKEHLSRNFMYRSKILLEFWNRWQREYLTSLRERYNIKGGENLAKVGHVVLIHDNVPRSNWKLGLITDVIMGSDGLIRLVKLKTREGITMRPVSKLYPLEVECVDSGKLKPVDISCMKRPMRAAASRANEKFHGQF